MQSDVAARRIEAGVLGEVMVALHMETTLAFHGAAHEDEPISFLPRVPLYDALVATTSSDVWATQYRLKSGEEYPRLAGDALPWIRQQGDDVVIETIWVDIDNAEHMRWETLNPEGPEFNQELPGLLNEAHAYYATRSGVRLVYVLKEPLTIEEWQAYIGGFMRQFDKDGGQADRSMEKGKKWCQAMRLPKVTRANEKLWKQPWFKMRLEGNRPRFDMKGRFEADSSLIKPVKPLRSNLIGDPGAQPDIEECKEIVAQHKDHPVMRLIRARINGEWYHQKLFPPKGEFTPLVDTPGSRDVKMLEVIGKLCHIMPAGYEDEESAPRLVYAIMAPSVFEMECNTTPQQDFISKLWEKILEFIPKEYAKVEAREEILIEGVKAWNPTANPKWVERHAVLSIGTKFLHITRDGSYTRNPTTSQMLLSDLRHHGADNILKLWKTTKQGVAPMTAQDVLNAYGYTPPSIIYSPGERVSHLEPDGSLVLSTYSLDDTLIPEHDDRVDEWLYHLMGRNEEDKVWLEHWIAAALMIEEGRPVCGLALAGPPGTGKKLLAHGLAECFTPTKVPVPFTTVCQRFNEPVTRNPILVLNEGFELKASWHVPPSVAFRCVVAGDTIQIEEKHGRAMGFTPTSRFLCTANNEGAILDLLGRNDLESDDREAILKRIRFGRVGREAIDFLAEHGNRNLTEGWISQRSDGTRTKFTAAKHFLSVKERYKDSLAQGGGRFLLEGDVDGALNSRLMAAGRVGAYVLDAMLSLANSPDVFSSTWSDSTHFYVIPTKLQAKYRELSGSTGSKDFLVGKALTIPGCEVGRYQNNMTKQVQAIRLPLKGLLEQAEIHRHEDAGIRARLRSKDSKQ